MKTKASRMLPKTVEEIQNGGIYLQRVRCGKTNCKCARGETHSAFYFYARHNGKPIKTYIRKAEVEQFSTLVHQAAIERKQRRHTIKRDLTMLKEMRQSLRDSASIINSLKGK